ncbi:MAG: hypothetical protein H6568_16825 [Lewinellaceae bacterium]|nr:hypothetical protein [Bacteroidota bacterium]MCB9314421.1 hypothetical protein [Lewinellaceae bacterium]
MSNEKKIMNRAIITILLVIQAPLFITAQNDETFEIQADKVDSNTNLEIQQFYEKFNSWIGSIGTDSAKMTLNENLMVNNFIIFSEDGLIMKDLSFHSTESCKKHILESLPEQGVDNVQSKWIYVSLESHVYKRDLIEILEFLKEQNIEYQFGAEDEFVPKLIKK